MKILLENLQYGFLLGASLLLLLPFYEGQLRRERNLWGHRVGFALRTTIFVGAGLVLAFRIVSREWANSSWEEPMFAYATIGIGVVLGALAVRFLAYVVKRTVGVTADDDALVGR